MGSGNHCQRKTDRRGGKAHLLKPPKNLDILRHQVLKEVNGFAPTGKGGLPITSPWFLLKDPKVSTMFQGVTLVVDDRTIRIILQPAPPVPRRIRENHQDGHNIEDLNAELLELIDLESQAATLAAAGDVEAEIARRYFLKLIQRSTDRLYTLSRAYH